MKEFSYLRAIPASFYSKALYRDVYANWKGFGFLYLFIAMLAFSIPVVLVFCLLSFTVTPQKPFDFTYILKQVPALTFKNGELALDAPQPVMIHTPDKGGSVIAIIDTTHDLGYWQEQSSETPMVMSKSQWVSRKNATTKELHDYPKDFNQTVTSSTLEDWLEMGLHFLWLVPLFVWPFFIGFTFVYRILQALLYGGFGIAIAHFTKTNVTYEQSVRLACVAVTPVLFLSLVLVWLFHLGWYTTFALAMVYLWYGMRVNSPHA